MTQELDGVDIVYNILYAYDWRWQMKLLHRQKNSQGRVWWGGGATVPCCPSDTFLEWHCRKILIWFFFVQRNFGTVGQGWQNVKYGPKNSCNLIILYFVKIISLSWLPPYIPIYKLYVEFCIWFIVDEQCLD